MLVFFLCFPSGLPCEGHTKCLVVPGFQSEQNEIAEVREREQRRQIERREMSCLSGFTRSALGETVGHMALSRQT